MTTQYSLEWVASWILDEDVIAQVLSRVTVLCL